MTDKCPLTWDDGACRGSHQPGREGTCSVKSVPGGKRVAKRRPGRGGRVRIGVPDAALTGSAGLAALGEVDRVLGLVQALDAGIGAIKVRDRGLSGGQLLMAMASCQLAGGDHLASLDRRRADTAGQRLEAVPTPPSRTAGGLARRFGPEALAGIESAIGVVNAEVVARVGQVRRSALLRQVTMDIDATDVEVYGPGKDGCAYNYQGQRAYRVDIALWAELGVPIAADLLAGNEDPRSSVVELIRRAHAGLPAGVEQVALRLDTGYFAADAAIAAHALAIRFAIGVKRNAAVWRAAATIPDSDYTPVIGMEDTEVALVLYAPKGWPPGGGLPGPPDPDPPRSGLHRPAGPETPHHPQRPTRPGVGRGPGPRLRVQLHPDQHRGDRPGRHHRCGADRRGRALVPPPHRHRRSPCSGQGARGWMKLGARLPLTSSLLGTVESVSKIDAGARPGGYPGLLP